MAQRRGSNGIGCRSGRLLVMVLLLVMAGAIQVAVAETVTADQFSALSEQEFSDWISTYYRAPQPELIPAFIRKAGGSGYLTREQTLPPIAGFLASFFAAHPDRVAPSLADAKSLPSRDYQTILVIVLVAPGFDPAKQRDRLAELDDYGNQLLSWFLASGIYGHDKVEPISPSALDFIWGSFLATGNAALVVPLIGVIVPPKNNKDAMVLAVSTAARWSLGSNARQHPKILELCKQQIPREPPAIAAELRKIVEQE